MSSLSAHSRSKPVLNAVVMMLSISKVPDYAALLVDIVILAVTAIV